MDPCFFFPLIISGLSVRVLFFLLIFFFLSFHVLSILHFFGVGFLPFFCIYGVVFFFFRLFWRWNWKFCLGYCWVSFIFLFSSTVWEFWIGRFWFRLVIRKLTISEISLLWVFVYLNIWCVLTEILLVWLIGFPFLLSPLNFFLFWKFPSKKQMHLSIDHHNVLERFSNLGGVKLF